MSDKFIRVYHKLSLDEVKEHLLVYGALSAQCANCQEADIKLNSAMCPKCGNTFCYIAFRNAREHMPKLQRISEERPEIKFIDYDDYKKQMDTQKARDFLK
jgi:hypothetical protein